MGLTAFAPLLLTLALPSEPGEARDQAPAKISVASPVAGGELFVDGRQSGALPVVGLEVPAGRHEVVVKKDGHGTFRKWVMARPGQITEVVAVLVPVPAAPTPAAKRDAVAAETVKTEAGPSKPVYESWIFWTAIGAAVVGGVALTVALTSSGDDFVPTGELGRTSTDDWQRL